MALHEACMNLKHSILFLTLQNPDVTSSRRTVIFSSVVSVVFSLKFKVPILFTLLLCSAICRSSGYLYYVTNSK